MTAQVLPFPLARRLNMIERQARYAADLGPEAANRHIASQLKVQAESMRRKGVDRDLIVVELELMEAAIRAALMHTVGAPGGRL